MKEWRNFKFRLHLIQISNQYFHFGVHVPHLKKKNYKVHETHLFGIATIMQCLAMLLKKIVDVNTNITKSMFSGISTEYYIPVSP